MTFKRADSERLRRLRLLTAPAFIACVAILGILLGKGEEPAVDSVAGNAHAESETPGTEQPTMNMVMLAPASESGSDAAAGNARLADSLTESLTPEPEPAGPREFERTISIARGDTLMEALVKAGASRKDAYDAIVALSEHFNPRRLQVGQELELGFLETDETGPRFARLAIEQDIDRKVAAIRDDKTGWKAEVTEQPLQRLTMRAAGRIDDSLFLAADRENVPVSVIVELIRIFSFDVDFQRDIRSGDDFEIYYERYATPDGNRIREGDILFAKLTLSGKPVALYRYKAPGGDRTDYFHADGTSARRALMKTPVDGARLSSTFGARRHPILGYTRMHKGLDFAAPRGTPIMAAGDGVIERANWYGSFGRYIKIRHNGTYKTAYAHLNGFAKGIAAGKRVKQGQVIGYIGTTGRSTGPHLHYEVFRDDKQVNPFSLKLPTGETLKGDKLVAFNGYRSAMDTEIAAIPLPYEVAGLNAQ